MTFKEDVIRVLKAEVEALRSKNLELEAKLEVIQEDYEFNNVKQEIKNIKYEQNRNNN
tara:strand:- start:274 stop:447 length:174 start_codon:yes stop_codon:yes gene_type:complete